MITNAIVKTYFKYSGYLFRIFPGLLSHILPRTLVVEASNICMLKCPACATVNASTREKGIMSFDTFKHIIDSTDWKIKRINFSYAGEPLINPVLAKMIRYAKEKGINSIVETNGMLLEERAIELVGCGLQKLSIAFDGINQDMVSKYRRGIDFEKVILGIKRIVSEKKEHLSQFPEIHLQLIVMKHNQAYLNQVISMAKTLGADFLDIKTMILAGGHGLCEDEKGKLAKEFLPTKKEYLRYQSGVSEWRLKSNSRRFCSHILSDTVIMWNGDVTICTMDVGGKLVVGNILNEPLGKIWRGMKYRRMRKYALNGSLSECSSCAYLVSDFRSVNLRKTGK